MQAKALYLLGRQKRECRDRTYGETRRGERYRDQGRVALRCAMAAADDGRLEEAERLISEAIEMVEPTDFLELRGETFEALAQVEDVQVSQMAGELLSKRS